MGVLRAKVDGVWVDVPPGPQGPQGAQGIQGIPGPTAAPAYMFCNYQEISLSAAVESAVPVATVHSSANFSVVANQVRAGVAGTFVATLNATLEGTGGLSDYHTAAIKQFRGSTEIRGIPVVQGRYTYWQTSTVTGIFDLLVDDEVRVYLMSTTAGTTDWRTWLTIVRAAY